MEFSLALSSIDVTIDGRHYTLKEATADVAAKWRNTILRSAKISQDGKLQSMEDVAYSEPFLVSMCLYDEKGPVPVQIVRSWPARVVKALFEEAKKLGDLDEKSKN